MGSEKLVGTQYLDLSRLKADVNETNALQKSIGAGVNLNMTGIVEKQIRAMLEKFRTEVANAASQSGKGFKSLGEDVRGAESRIKDLIGTTQRLSKDGSVVSTQKGYDELNRVIVEVTKNGELLSRTMKADSTLTKDIQYANELYKQQIDALRQLNALKTQRLTVKDDTPTAVHLDEQILKTGQLIQRNRELISAFDEQAVKRSNLSRLATEEAALDAKYLSAQIRAQEQAADAAAKRELAERGGADQIRQTQQALNQLSQAYRGIQTAAKNGDESSKAYWTQKANAAKDELAAIESGLGKLNIEEGARERIVAMIRQAGDAEQTHARTMDELGSKTNDFAQAQDRAGGQLLNMAVSTLVLRGLKNMWSEAVSFASKYYDQLNEIRTVTMRSEADVNKLGSNYRKLGKEMKVSATEIATAAVTYYRQGLPDEKVNERLLGTIQYAKVAAMEFGKASEIITSATNSLEISAQRASDVMIYLGDAAGTSADEVGTAMQRSAAAADAFGLSFEWLGAYIATVSEKTRLAPEVIGTAFNSILARMHSIKEKGYNEEDETQINDVAKALDKVNVALLDQDKSWRDASDIFADVAVQWDTLDAKTQAYIATVIAGARNQNVFLTLMNDMSKAAEGNSRAVELYNGALNSAGTTAAKYAIWQESVAAAQGQLTAALQDFYALLNADWLKGFYSGMADLVGLMTSGTEALRGWNILLPVLGVGLMSVVSIIMKVVTAIQAASGAVGVLTALTGGALPALLAVAGLAAGVVTAVAGISKQAVTPADYSGQIDDLSSHIDRVKALRDEYAELTATQDRSQAESQRMKQIIDELSGSSLTLKYALAGTTDGFLDQTDALKTLNAYLIETSNRLIQLKREEAALSFKDVESIREAQDRVNQADKQESLWKEYDAFKGTDHYKQGVSFSQYVRGKIMEYSDIEHFDEQMKWAELDDMLNNLVDGFFVWDDQITAALENLNLHAQGSAENARSQMESVWQTYADLLRVFAVGPQYDGMNSYFKEQMDAYANRLIDGFDLNTEVTGERLTEAGNKLLAKQAELAAMLENDTTLRDLFKNYDELMPQIDPEDLAALDDLNAVVEKINEILATKNESLPDGEKLALLPVLDTTGQREAQKALQDVTILSEDMEKYFAKLQQSREAREAADKLYVDQIRALKSIWETNEDGRGKSNTAAALNEMHAANKELTEGMLETHTAFATLFDDEVTYEDGLNRLTEMERLSVKQSQEKTKALMDEAEATRKLNEQKKDNYAALINEMADTFTADGYDAFVAKWEALPEAVKNDLIALVPEVAKLAAGMYDAADGAAIFANALNNINATKLEAFTRAMNEASEKRVKSDAARAAKDNRYDSQLKDFSKILRDNTASEGYVKLREAMYKLKQENSDLFEGLIETYPVLTKLFGANMDQAKASGIMAEAFGMQAEASAKNVQEILKQIRLEEELAAAKESNYKTTLEAMRDAFEKDGIAGFDKELNKLDSSALKTILSMYGKLGELAEVAMKQGKDAALALLDELIAEANGKAAELREKALTDGAKGYADRQEAQEAKNTGFQSQLIELRDALTDGTFMEVLASFKQEVADALLGEHDWLNGVIENYERIKAGTLDVTDVLNQFNEHIIGTDEQFLASAEAMVEANRTLLQTEEEQIEVLSRLYEALSEDDGLESFKDAWNGLGEEMQEALIKKVPVVNELLGDLNKGAQSSSKSVDKLGKEIKKIDLKRLQREGKVWNELTDVMAAAGKNGADFAKKYGSSVKRVEELSEAMGALEFVQNSSGKSAKDLADAYQVLSSFSGASVETLQNDLSPALWAISSESDMASASVAWLANWLQSAANVQFTASNWQSQLATLANSADATTANVATLVATLLQAAGATLSLDGNTVQVNWGNSGNYRPPSARGGGGGVGGGGGGGGGSKSKKRSKIEILLENMKNIKAMQDHQREMIRLAREYHALNGEIQGMIQCLEAEYEHLQRTQNTIKSNIDVLEQQIAAKQKELAKYKEGSAKYKKLYDELMDLIDAYRDYSQELQQNRNDLVSLAQAMQEQRDAIRDMEIELREMIQQAILDREALNKRMLQGRIDVENEILNIVTRNHEKERDMILESSQLKIDALNEEIRLLDEQLAARKKLADQEDKAAKLAKLEAQLARISADPTRKKEELKLREEIAKLREDIAWDIADAEVESQKKSLAEQITSVEDYMAYVESYYEELLSNPRKLLEEFQALLQKADDEILAWLVRNSEDYATATDAAREDMINGWQEMLDDMHGAITTYWAEVESIIEQGDDAIIAFLMEHSEEYRQAGELQAQKFVDEWKKKLEELRNAYKQVASEINNTPIKPPSAPTTSGSSGGSSGGGGSGGSGGTTTKQFVASGTGYGEAYKATATTVTYGGQVYVKAANQNYWFLKTAAQQIDGGRTYYWKTGTTRYVKKYAQGGQADFTGPAWLDGTKSKPERILSPYQTELFEDMLKSLHAIKLMKPPSMFMPDATPKASGMFTIEAINVNVEKLETDEDYEEIARRVGESIYNEMVKGAPVGGLRLR